ncbi:MAG: hypothetical protein AAFN94_00725 [Pseudomonadota bacterium]
MIYEDALAQLFAESRSMLARAGLSVRTQASTEMQEEEMFPHRKRENHPVLSTSHHDFAADDAFSIMVDDESGLAAGMACKHVRLGRDNLANHLASSNRRFYGDGLVTANRSVAAQLSGSLAYQGELFLLEKWRQGKAPVSAIMHLAHSLCALKWNADWHFAFMPVAILHKSPAWGFHRHQLCTQKYHESIPLRSSLECLVYSSRQEICERAETISEQPNVLHELSARSNS